jgi:hypothetical protein
VLGRFSDARRHPKTFTIAAQEVGGSNVHFRGISSFPRQERYEIRHGFEQRILIDRHRAAAFLLQGGRPECSGGLDRQGEDVPDAALGLDNAGRAGIDLELTSQSQNLDVDATVEHILVDAGRL